jgi:hypothetical protein
MLWAARDYDRAGRYRREALEVARATNDQTLVARSLNRVGNWFVNREDPHSGIPYHNEALAMFEQMDDRRGVAETVDLLAMANHIAGARTGPHPTSGRSRFHGTRRLPRPANALRHRRWPPSRRLDRFLQCATTEL